MRQMTRLLTSTAFLFCAILPAASAGEKYAANPPVSIHTPDSVGTSVGTLKFRDGAPDARTAEMAYRQVDLGRGVEAFLQGICPPPRPMPSVAGSATPA